MSKDILSTLHKDVLKLCTMIGIHSGRTVRHPMSLGVTFIATHAQYAKFYDVVTDSGFRIEHVEFKKINNPGDPPSYFYDFSITR